MKFKLAFMSAAFLASAVLGSVGRADNCVQSICEQPPKANSHLPELSGVLNEGNLIMVDEKGNKIPSTGIWVCTPSPTNPNKCEL